MAINDYLLIVAGILLLVLLLFQIGRRERRRLTDRGQGSYKEALRHLVDGEIDLAYARLVETVRDDTSNIDAYILLGDLLRQRGNLERALKVHRDATLRTDLSPESNRVLLKSLALDYLAAGRWGAAERTLNDLDHQTRRGSTWARLRLLEVYEAQEDWGAAYELARDLGDHPQVGPARLARYLVEQAARLSAEGHHHKARLVLKDAIKHDRGCADAYGMIGDSYAEEGRIEDAIEWWEQLVRAAPGRAAEVFKGLENHLYELGEFERMAGIYERFLEEDPGNVDATLAFAHFLQRKGQLDRAVDILNRLRPRCAEPSKVEKNLVLLYYRAGEREKALDLAITLCERDLQGQEEMEGTATGPEKAVPDWVTSGGAWDPSHGEEEGPA